MRKLYLLLLFFLCMAQSVQAQEAYAVLSNDGKTVTFYYDSQKESRGGIIINNTKLPDSEVSPYGRATTAVIHASFANYRPTSTAYWFQNCFMLATITGMENLNTTNVTRMDAMFSKCSSLTSLDLRNFDTSNVESMIGMFEGCEELLSLDVSSFNTSNVTDVSGMFLNCYELTSLYVSNFNTTSVTSMSFMFAGCWSLTNLDVTNFDTSNVRSMSFMFVDCYSLTSLDVTNFDTSNVTDMEGMFKGCYGLTSLDVSNFNTANVTDMYGMFEDCSSLTRLDVSKFDTGKVTYMSQMFLNCSSLMSLNVRNFDTRKVIMMNYMFAGCYDLTSLDLSNFNTTNVEYMSSMFADCTGLTSLDLSNFDTSNVTVMYEMFHGCTGLTRLDLSHFDTGNVTDMGGMFKGCTGLKNLDLSSFNTNNVTYEEFDDSGMGGMFEGCTSLKSLDLSNFNTSNVKIMREMFKGCSALTTIYAGEEWSTEKVTDGENMFTGCTKLIGGKGTEYDENHTDYTYAHIDGGAGNPGYLTDIAEMAGCTDVSALDNVIYVEPMEVRTGTEAVISFKMKNTAAIRGFQFDLYLPEGVTVVKSNNGKIQGQLSAGRLPDEDEHQLTFSEHDGFVRFLCSSQYPETFTGTSGEIATLKVNIAEGIADGDYAIQLKDIKLTETDISKYYETPLVQSKMTISTYVTGDISGDGEVDVSDYTGVANYIHGSTPAGFNSKAADVDNSGTIDVSDYTGIANIIHTGSIYGRNNARSKGNERKKKQEGLDPQ